MYDLIIVGGGISGISVAHYFRDHNILLLERGELLQEASGKNAGFIISGFGEHFHSTVKRFGMGRAVEIQDYHLSNHRRIQKLAANFECKYQRNGSYAVALDVAESDHLRRSADLMKARGYDVEWMETPLLGLKQTQGALWNPEDASMDPVSFWGRVAAGLPVITDCEVMGVSEEDGTIGVQTTKGEFRCGSIVYCINAFAAPLVRELEGRFIPVRGQMLELSLSSNPPTGCPVFTNYGDVYWRFTEDALLFGGLESRYPEHEIGVATEPSKEILSIQLKWIQEHFDGSLFHPQVNGDLRPNRVWCGTMSFTVDGFPFVGQLPGRNRYVLSGLCGLGHSYSLECAAWLYEKIAHSRDIIPTYCSSDRIDGLPEISGGNWRSIYEAWNH